MPLIKCENTAFSYEGITVLEGLNFAVEKGDYLCIVGENGSGKSTLADGILGLIKPSYGKITFEGGISSKRIGYLQQKTDFKLDFPASVSEVVVSGCAKKNGFLPFYSKKSKETAEKNMKLMNVYELKSKSFSKLSGGQQQRVLLARALCSASDLLLLDEPVAGLDAASSASMYEITKRLNTEHKIAVIMVSHDIKTAVKYATHILHLQNKQVFFGKTAEYLKTSFASHIIGGEQDA